jgi:hypothetical protein
VWSNWQNFWGNWNWQPFPALDPLRFGVNTCFWWKYPVVIDDYFLKLAQTTLLMSSHMFEMHSPYVNNVFILSESLSLIFENKVLENGCWVRNLVHFNISTLKSLNSVEIVFPSTLEMRISSLCISPDFVQMSPQCIAGDFLGVVLVWTGSENMDYPGAFHTHTNRNITWSIFGFRSSWGFGG